MRVRKSTVLFYTLIAFFSVFLFLYLHALYSIRNNAGAVAERAHMVKVLGLTDLCLFTDARYTRNPAMADLATAFQDHPLSLEHFPSGSIVSPPAKVAHGLD